MGKKGKRGTKRQKTLKEQKRRCILTRTTRGITWLIKDDKELKTLCFCELNKYLVNNGLHKYLRKRNPDKIYILQQHCFS
jgi:hypothetical protein